MVTPTPPPRRTSLPWTYSLAVLLGLLGLGGAFWWITRDPPEQPLVYTPVDPNQPPALKRDPGLAKDARFHSIAFGEENGVRVVKFRLAENGDEIVVDAATGRFIESRAVPPMMVPPMGKLAAPFMPMM